MENTHKLKSNLQTGKKIKSIRSELNMSQKRFGYKIGLSGKTISAYETGRTTPPYRVLEKINEVYNVHLSNLSTRNMTTFKDKLKYIENALNELKTLLGV